MSRNANTVLAKDILNDIKEHLGRSDKAAITYLAERLTNLLYAQSVELEEDALIVVDLECGEPKLVKSNIPTLNGVRVLFTEDPTQSDDDKLCVVDDDRAGLAVCVVEFVDRLEDELSAADYLEDE